MINNEAKRLLKIKEGEGLLHDNMQLEVVSFVDDISYSLPFLSVIVRVRRLK